MVHAFRNARRHAPAATGLVAGLALAAAPAMAQAPGRWNDPSALALVQRARDLRSTRVVDPSFRSYQAEARGYVYFFFDRPGTDERNLVKADQIALDVFWQAPNQTRQTIVGQRDEKLLPTDIRYHLDHLTIVQDDFGDLIRMGDGDEVSSVLHPVGPGAEATYDFLLADSLSIRYAGGSVQVYEVRVRPKDFDRPGFVGAIYLDRANAALVRMSFSFTPASYVDPYVDYIRVSLDNSLWEGRHWLPYRQEIEIRREIPLLDVMAGSVIRGRFEIGRYDFNVDLPPTTFVGGRVGSVSPAERGRFEFERGLFDDLEEEGLSRSTSLEDVRTQVRQVVQDRTLSGLAPFRLHFAATSDAARYNRAEGIRIGAGFTVRPAEDLVMRVSGGYAIGRGRASGIVSTSRSVGRVQPVVDAYWDDMADVGGYLGASTLENTISSASGSVDYTDPYFRRGGQLTLRFGPPGSVALSLGWERHLGARDVVSDDPSNTDFRPVRSIEEGDLSVLRLLMPLGLPGDGRLDLTGRLGRMGGRTFGAGDAEALWDLARPGRPWSGEISAAGGVLTDEAPPQWTYLLGGRWSIPGHEYRAFAGDRYWLLRGEATVPVRRPYVGVRAIGALGATYLGSRSLPVDWAALDSDGLRAALGAGLSFGWDALRLDFARGFPDGEWEALFSVARRFRSWL